MPERTLVPKVSEAKSKAPSSRLQKLERMQSLKSSALQAKLRIGQPNDIYEQEADRVAEQIMRMPDPVLQRKCAKCDEDKKKVLQTKKSSGQASLTQEQGILPIVHDVLRSPGQPLDSATRSFFEPRFGYDFSGVRVHTDSKAAESTRAVNALAYTVGRDLVLGYNEYSPNTMGGKRLLAHELTHVIQQSQNQNPSTSVTGSVLLQRQVHGTPSPISVRSPVFEELVTQISSTQAGLTGRLLMPDEIALVRKIFHNSIDYSRVRLIPTGVLEYRTVANFIRVPENFTISNEYMAQTLVHEMTHVWQYQHGGTSYISVSLATQIAGTIRTGSRNAAYDYLLTPGKSFFDFLPEQQGLIVENYFSMLRDKNAPPKLRYVGNHLKILSWSDRMAEISRELPLHQPLIGQMQAAFPRPEVDLLTIRATEVMRTSPEGVASIPEERNKTLIKPLLEIKF